METVETIFEDAKLFYPKVYADDRGFFTESYNQIIQDELGETFIQDNHSKSKAGVIRGLHYQWDRPMGKLLRVVKGSGFDTIVDIRKTHQRMVYTQALCYQMRLLQCFGYGQGLLRHF